MEKTKPAPKPAKQTRVDLALVERDLCKSREKAKRAVMAGQVFLNGQKAIKASDKVKPSDELTITGAEKFERSACEMKRIFEGQGGFKNTVESIEVVPGGSEAKIVWRIKSTDGKTEVRVETTLDVNLITGKILSQDDRWSFVKGGESIELKRKALAVPDNVGNAMDEIMRTVDDATRAARELANSNGGEDEFGVDPNDPMKFFSYELTAVYIYNDHGLSLFDY